MASSQAQLADGFSSLNIVCWCGVNATLKRRTVQPSPFHCGQAQGRCPTARPVLRLGILSWPCAIKERDGARNLDEPKQAASEIGRDIIANKLYWLGVTKAGALQKLFVLRWV